MTSERHDTPSLSQRYDKSTHRVGRSGKTRRAGPNDTSKGDLIAIEDSTVTLASHLTTAHSSRLHVTHFGDAARQAGVAMCVT